MAFKELEITKDFKKEIIAIVCYIYKVDKEDSSIKTVYYYRYDNGEFKTKSVGVQPFANMLINNVIVAYCGKINNGKLVDVAKVIPMIKDGAPYLTTMRDDSETNNLTALFDYYK